MSLSSYEQAHLVDIKYDFKHAVSDEDAMRGLRSVDTNIICPNMKVTEFTKLLTEELVLLRPHLAKTIKAYVMKLS